MKDPYETLGVRPDASDDEIKKAYRQLAKKYHPDAMQGNPLADLAEEKMKEINEAHDLIQKMRKGGGNSGFNANSGYGGGQPDPLSMQIRQALATGNISLAEQLMGQMPKDSAEYFFLLGHLAYRKGWLDEARQNFNQAYQRDPNNAEYRQAVEQGIHQSAQPFGRTVVSPCPCCCLNPCDCLQTWLCLRCCCGGC